MVYFMQRAGGGPIKIGCTQDVEARHRQLQSCYRCPLEILATLPGEYEVESEMHRRFAHLRIGRTEQFRPGPDLLAFIGQAVPADHNPDAAQLMDATVFNVRMDDEYREWFDGLRDVVAERVGVQSVTRLFLLDMAIGHLAEHYGMDRPPRRG